MQKEIESLQTPQEVPRAQRRPVAKPLDHFTRHYPDTAQVMALAYLSGDYTMKAIADHFEVHYTTVSRAVKEFEAMGKRYG